MLTRFAPWFVFYALIALAWLGLYAVTPAVDGGAIFGSLGFTYSWAAHGDSSFFNLLGMWCLMALGMMLPTLLPYFRCLDDLVHRQAERRSILALFCLAYCGVWMAFAVAAAGLQFALIAMQWIDSAGISAQPYLTAGLLIVAGLYQFSQWKAACLSQCQAPMQFFLAKWQDGASGAAQMGLRHGVICLGCCWALMLLGFVGGTLNLVWMGVATVLMALEKISLFGRILSPAMGVGFLALGTAALLRALIL